MKSRWSLAAMRVPYLPSSRYDLELDLVRVQGEDGIGIVLPIEGDAAVAIVFGGYPGLGSLDGLNYVDDQNLSENGTGTKSCLRNNAPIRLSIRVRPNRINYRYQCHMEMIDTVYDIEDRTLRVDDRIDVGEQKSLALYQVRGQSRFSEIRLRDYGQGRFISAW